MFRLLYVPVFGFPGLHKKEGALQVHASLEGLAHPNEEATDEEARPNERAPRKPPFPHLKKC